MEKVVVVGTEPEVHLWIPGEVEVPGAVTRRRATDTRTRTGPLGHHK